MNHVFLSVTLRILLFISLAMMVFDFLRVEQQFTLMNRGYTEGFSVQVTSWPGSLMLIVLFLFVVGNVVYFLRLRKNKNTDIRDFITFEYDSTDERAIANTRKAVSYAFSGLLIYSFFMIGSFMFIPNYFLDHIWYPLFATASIPISGLIIYAISFTALQRA
ncbi:MULTISPECIES: hypothetical protein [Sporosarcina]|uniref:hypothetical protein n=1 Tax=Sporosarcina TaxID=1569 RepID=UPI000C167218|nr:MULTISPECIES: hypothetical protein [Sporosarcina]PIC74879.1 hypothetical protein CSV76_03250 [Sporosarcina sp. P17b]